MDSNGIMPTYNVGGDAGGSWIFLFAILALMWGGNGFFGGNNENSNAIQNDVNRGFDNQNLQAQTRDILGAVTSGTAQSVAATNQVFHDMLFALNDKYGEVQRDIANLAVGQANLLAKQNGISFDTFNEYDWNYVLNMVYSDYYGAVPNELSSYYKLARSFLMDKDAPEGKALKYYLAMD